jgi:salicylate hydroxylase
VTCLLGTATIAREARGICLPSSATTKCHGAFYPTGPTEQCFQFHFPVPAESATKGSLGSWGNLTEHVGQEECGHLAERLKKDGWDEKYLTPLHHVDKALMIGFSKLDPPLESYTYGRVVLLGDAAHPPVPYLGQGAQQGLEDAGTLALLLQRLCCVVEGGRNDEKAKQCFSLGHVDAAIKLYDQMRVPRTAAVLEKSKNWGNMQQKKSECKKYNEVKEEMMRRDLFFHETFPVLFLGVKHDYKEEVMRTLEEVRLLPVPEEESF